MILFNFVICDSHGGYTVKEGLFIMHNLDLFQAFTPEYYGFPDVPPCSLVDSSDFLPFNFRDKKSDCLDFFCDDRFFECVWKNPLGYVDLFRSYRFIVQPDFSLFYDMPIALQIYNKYRNHTLAAFYSMQGVRVIPNINLSTPCCFNWSIRGYPKNSVVAFSSIGSLRSRSDRYYLFRAYDYMINKLDPVGVLWFGSSVDCPSECKTFTQKNHP